MRFCQVYLPFLLLFDAHLNIVLFSHHFFPVVQRGNDLKGFWNLSCCVTMHNLAHTVNVSVFVMWLLYIIYIPSVHLNNFRMQAGSTRFCISGVAGSHFLFSEFFHDDISYCSSLCRLVGHKHRESFLIGFIDNLIPS